MNFIVHNKVLSQSASEIHPQTEKSKKNLSLSFLEMTAANISVVRNVIRKEINSENEY